MEAHHEPPDREPEGNRPKAMRPVWWLVSGVLLAATVGIAATRHEQLADAVRLLSSVRAPQVTVAALCEAASLACLAALQFWLLRAAGARTSFKTLGGIVLGANVVADSLPGGAAFAAAWAYRQLRRYRVEQALAGAVLAASGTLSALTLFALLLCGVLAGGSPGPDGELRPAVVGLTLLAALALGVAYGLTRFRLVRRRLWRRWRRIGLRSRRLLDIENSLATLTRHLRTSRPGARPWLVPVALALGNWLLDLACLTACAWSLGIGVPWHGIVTVYALTQMAGSLRLTPGGLGIVETSLTALLAWYGLKAEEAIAVTLLYRVMNYWALQPLGWAALLALALNDPHRTGRRGRRR